MGSLAMFGVPPEISSLQGIAWPYDITKIYTQAPPMEVSFAALNYQGFSYALIDKPETPDVLMEVKKFLAAGFPMAFGFDYFDSINQAERAGAIPVLQ